ncbi:MAG: hypothetical protein HS104_33235 [Polyangiaceae bacterium]|nr:hypothetical protein [Polyangiaceae bacterium]MBK8997852.1 hypothetical protein [Myxococcales bacterium]MCE7890075.1 hypothetical protein [Sorangiineae bacterium PRO1]MCL4756395.1 hypothetical protein [Myxococcales bacterium]
MRSASVAAVGFGLGLMGCGGATLPESGSLAPSAPAEQAKCKVAASQESPLVTEWPASEKARFEALTAKQVVAVEYSGCEMKIVDSCQVAGSYGFKQTTLATDTVEIANSDELFAKLPLGAASLEGQLARSGRLAVKTTVAGQLQLLESPALDLTKQPSCARVTHIVRAISVGSFRLLAGGAVSAGGGASVGPVGGGAASRREESTVREAGDPARCPESTDSAPHPQCASPIQVFLTPVREPAGQATAASTAEPVERADAVNITFPEREGELWALYDEGGKVLCEVPCTRWVPRASGYKLRRQSDAKEVEIPDRLGNVPGSNARAKYYPERGAPLWGAITFYGLGLPAAIGGTTTLIIGLAKDDEDKSFYFGASALYLSIAAGTAAWYWLFTDWAHFEAEPIKSARSRSRGPELFLGPASVSGTF